MKNGTIKARKFAGSMKGIWEHCRGFDVLVAFIQPLNGNWHLDVAAPEYVAAEGTYPSVKAAIDAMKAL